MITRLMRFLTLGVGEPEQQPAESAPAEESFDDLLDLASTIPDPEAAPAGDEAEAAEIEKTRRRLADAENQLVAERAARAAAEARANVPQQRMVDPDWQREEEEIASARSKQATPEQLAWLQWKIDGNRKIRQSERNSFGALVQAQDLQDRVAFDQELSATPGLKQRYAARVEAAMNEMRSRGQNAPRMAVLRLMIGDDAMSGKIKRKSAPATVDRGRTPGVRSDTTAKGKLSEHEKRTARLIGRNL